jgi:monothiol glutaredoxin
MGAAPATGGQQAVSADDIVAEIKREIAEHKILVYGKGTKDQPMCGFTLETRQFFEQFGHPFEILNVLDNPAKRQVLTQMTDWPTLPKVFINGEFYGDTDILGPMHEKGELTTLLAETFK